MFVGRGLPQRVSQLMERDPLPAARWGGGFIAEMGSKQDRARLAEMGHGSRSRGPCDWLPNLGFLCLKPFLFFWLRKRVMRANNRNEKKFF